MCHDIEETSKLIRADDEVVYGDSAYLWGHKTGKKFNRMNIFGRLSSAPTSGPAATKRRKRMMELIGTNR